MVSKEHDQSTILPTLLKLLVVLGISKMMGIFHAQGKLILDSLTAASTIVLVCGDKEDQHTEVTKNKMPNGKKRTC